LAELAYRIFSINPTQANCERNFSILNWMLGENRTNLTLNKLEVIAKIRSYYMNNIQKELNYVGKNLIESELKESINITSISNIIGLKDETNTNGNNSESTLPSQSYSNTKLDIGDIVDLTVHISDINEENSSDIIPAEVEPLNLADLIYDPQDVLNEFLANNTS
jgi:hypothetical protein